MKEGPVMKAIYFHLFPCDGSKGVKLRWDSEAVLVAITAMDEEMVTSNWDLILSQFYFYVTIVDKVFCYIVHKRFLLILS